MNRKITSLLNINNNNHEKLLQHEEKLTQITNDTNQKLTIQEQKLNTISNQLTLLKNSTTTTPTKPSSITT